MCRLPVASRPVHHRYLTHTATVTHFALLSLRRHFGRTRTTMMQAQHDMTPISLNTRHVIVLELTPRLRAYCTHGLHRQQTDPDRKLAARVCGIVRLHRIISVYVQRQVQHYVHSMCLQKPLYVFT